MGLTITEVVSGGSRGIDRLGERWATENGIPWVRFPADWHRYGRGAPMRRNQQMNEYAQAIVAIWDGVSQGTLHMVEDAQAVGLVEFVFRVEELVAT